jgi:hypothetical protein
LGNERSQRQPHRITHGNTADIAFDIAFDIAVLDIRRHHLRHRLRHRLRHLPTSLPSTSPSTIAFGITDIASDIASGIASVITADIASDISNKGAISSVNLLMNNIPMEEAEALTSIFIDHPTLKSLCGNSGDETELDMSGKGIGAVDAVMLAAEILGNGALTSLNLSSNNLNAEGAKIVAEAVKVTKCAIAVVLAPFLYAHLTTG